MTVDLGGAKNYTDSFGLQWNRFSHVQLDSRNGAGYSRQRFLVETGWTRKELEGRIVFDGGCGSGRFAEIAAEFGGIVIALDYSSAVEAAARNLSPFNNVSVVRGDLLRPPIKAGSVDFVYSIGVIQHTPDPIAAIRAMIRLLKPGGAFTFTIYARRWYTMFYSKYLLRPFTTRVAPKRLLRSIEMIMPLAFPVTDVLFRLPIIGKMAQFIIPIANYVHKKDFTRSQRYAEAILDTFDMLAPAFDRPMTSSEVEWALQEEGVGAYEFKRRVPIEVTGCSFSGEEA